MKTKISDTSIKCYHEEIKGTRQKSEADIICEAIKRIMPCTGRQIMKATGMEINVVSRALNDLWFKYKRIEIAFKDNCPISGRWVKFYKTNTDTNGQYKLDYEPKND